jgi:hypothetical protein
MKKIILLGLSLLLVVSTCFAASLTPYYSLQKMDRFDTNWDTTINSNWEKIDTAIHSEKEISSNALLVEISNRINADNLEIMNRTNQDNYLYNQILLKYGDIVARLGNLPEVYVTSSTFNGSTGITITLPKIVSSISEYASIVVPTSRGAAIGDIHVVQDLTQFTVKCAESNISDTFKVVIFYRNDLNPYGTSINRKWYVSPLDSITDHCNNATIGSMAWVRDQIAGYYADVELPGNHEYALGQNCTITSNIRLIKQKGAVFSASHPVVLTINGNIDFPKDHTFDDNVTVHFASGISPILGEWFNNNLYRAYQSSIANSIIQFDGDQTVSAPVIMIKSGVHIDGITGKHTVRPTADFSGNSMFQIGDFSEVGEYPQNELFLSLKNFVINGSTSDTVGTQKVKYPIEIRQVLNGLIDHVYMSWHTDEGIYFNGTGFAAPSWGGKQDIKINGVQIMGGTNCVKFRDDNNTNSSTIEIDQMRCSPGTGDAFYIDANFYSKIIIKNSVFEPLKRHFVEVDGYVNITVHDSYLEWEHVTPTWIGDNSTLKSFKLSTSKTYGPYVEVYNTNLGPHAAAGGVSLDAKSSLVLCGSIPHLPGYGEHECTYLPSAVTYPNFIVPRWDTVITDYGNATQVGSIKWIIDRVSAYRTGDHTFDVTLPNWWYPVLTDFTIPSGTRLVFQEGSALSVAYGKTVTFASGSSIEAPDKSQIFRGTGSIVIGSDVGPVHTSWFDDNMTSAYKALTDNTLLIVDGIGKISTTINFKKSRVSIQGNQSSANAYVYPAAPIAGPMIDVGNGTTQTVYNTFIKDLWLDGTGTLADYGIRINNGYGFKVDNVVVSDTKYDGIIVYGGSSYVPNLPTLHHVRINDVGRYCLNIDNSASNSDMFVNVDDFECVSPGNDGIYMNVFDGGNATVNMSKIYIKSAARNGIHSVGNVYWSLFGGYIGIDDTGGNASLVSVLTEPISSHGAKAVMVGTRGTKVPIVGSYCTINDWSNYWY